MKRPVLFAAATSLLTALALPLLGGAGPAGADTDALTASPTTVAFGPITVGDQSPNDVVTLTNTSAGPVTITSIDKGGADTNDFEETDN